MIKSPAELRLQALQPQRPVRPVGGRVDLTQGDPTDGEHAAHLRSLGAVLVTTTQWPPPGIKPVPKKMEIMSATVPRNSAETVRDFFAQHMPNVPGRVKETRSLSASADGFEGASLTIKPAGLPVYKGASASEALETFGPTLMALGASEVTVTPAVSKQVIQVVVSDVNARRRVADYLSDNLPNYGALIRVSERRPRST